MLEKIEAIKCQVEDKPTTVTAASNPPSSQMRKRSMFEPEKCASIGFFEAKRFSHLMSTQPFDDQNTMMTKSTFGYNANKWENQSNLLCEENGPFSPHTHISRMRDQFHRKDCMPRSCKARHARLQTYKFY